MLYSSQSGSKIIQKNPEQAKIIDQLRFKKKEQNQTFYLFFKCEFLLAFKKLEQKYILKAEKTPLM